MKRTIIILAAVALAGLIMVAASWRHGSRPGAVAAAPASPPDLREEIAAVRQELARLKNKEPVRIDLGTLKAHTGQEPAEPQVSDMPGYLARAKQRELETATHLQRVLASEPHEADTSAQIARQTLDAIKDVAVGTSVERADCTPSLCRLVLSNADQGAHRQLAGTLVESNPFNAELLFQRDLEATPPRTTLYVIREGHSLRDLLATANP